jgi:excisionase family DNA binding protein
MNQEYLTIAEALDLLRISRATYYRLVRAGTIQPRKIGPGANGKVLILRAEVEALLQSSTR